MEKEKLLGDIPISDGTGKQIAQNVFKLLKDWNIEKNIVGLSFNTTSANTRSENGANIHLEMLLEKPLFWFASQHHILELVLSAAIKCKLGQTSGPNDPFSSIFQGCFNGLSRNNMESIIEKAAETIRIIAPKDDVT